MLRFIRGIFVCALTLAIVLFIIALQQKVLKDAVGIICIYRFFDIKSFALR